MLQMDISNSEKLQYVLPNDQPIVQLDCLTAFNNLTSTEKLYAHYLSKACWYGGLITLVQTSPESPLLFSFFHKMFSRVSVPKLKEEALKVGFTEEEFQVSDVNFFFRAFN